MESYLGMNNMDDNELKEKKELGFYRVFFRFTFPCTAFVILIGMFFKPEYSIKYVVLCWMQFIFIVIAAYVFARWILKSPEMTRWLTRPGWKYWWWPRKSKDKFLKKEE